MRLDIETMSQNITRDEFVSEIMLTLAKCPSYYGLKENCQGNCKNCMTDSIKFYKFKDDREKDKNKGIKTLYEMIKEDGYDNLHISISTLDLCIQTLVKCEKITEEQRIKYLKSLYKGDSYDIVFQKFNEMFGKYELSKNILDKLFDEYFPNKSNK